MSRRIIVVGAFLISGILISVGIYSTVTLLRSSQPNSQPQQTKPVVNEDRSLIPQEPAATLDDADYGRDGIVSFTPNAPLP